MTDRVELRMKSDGAPRYSVGYTPSGLPKHVFGALVPESDFVLALTVFPGAREWAGLYESVDSTKWSTFEETSDHFASRVSRTHSF